MTDPFAEVVALLQPSLSFSKAASGSGVWRVEASPGGQPFFCVILEGAAKLAIQGRGPMDLREGDFLLVPAATDFTMSSSDAAEQKDRDPLSVTKLTDETRHGDPHGAPNMRLLAGHIAFASPDAPMLIALLPRLIHVRGEKRLATMVQLIRNEAKAERPARDMIIDHLLQVLLIEALRSASDGVASPGLLRGLADERLSSAIRSMHEAPDSHWTIEQLARHAGLSRSVFFDRFRREVGLPPMEYLLSWRMALAKGLLRRREGGIKEVAQRVGYGSASAFSVAFTRFVGIPPAHYGRQIRNAPRAN